MSSMWTRLPSSMGAPPMALAQRPIAPRPRPVVALTWPAPVIAPGHSLPRPRSDRCRSRLVVRDRAQQSGLGTPPPAVGHRPDPVGYGRIRECVAIRFEVGEGIFRVGGERAAMAHARAGPSGCDQIDEPIGVITLGDPALLGCGFEAELCQCRADPV